MRRALAPLLLLLVAAAPAHRGATAAGTVGEQIGNGPAHPVAGAVVYLVGAVPASGKPRPRQVIQQKDLKFTPAYTVIMKGDTVEFPNKESSAVDHNVFSPREAGTTWFNLGRFGRGKSGQYTFRRAGVYDIYCDIHPDMRAQVKVVDNELYTTTDAAGAFKLADVPDGTYEVRAWRPNSVEALGQVTVAAGAASGPVSLVFRSAASSGPRRHKRLDGSAYPEYGGAR